MKSKYADEIISKIIIIAIIVILVGAMIYWVMGVYKDKKGAADSANSKINSANHEMADFDLLVYDGKSIDGDSLKELIDELKTNKVEVAVRVVTLGQDKLSPKGYTDYTYTYTDSSGAITPQPTPTIPTTSKSEVNYITPSANFLGEVIRNTNDEIVCLKFTQQN